MKHFYIKFLRFALVSLLLNGNYCLAQQSYLDSSFGNNGVVSATHFEAKAIAVQQDGKLVVTGGTNIRRFNTDGSPDADFGVQGSVDVTPMGITGLASVAQLDNGQLLLMGGKNARYAFLRLNTDGSTDTTFGTNGVKLVVHDFNIFGYWDTPGMMILAPGGKIMSIGMNKKASPGIWDVYVTRAVIARYNADLSLDLTFNGTGYKKFETPGMGFQLKDVAVHSGGDAFVGLQAGGNVKLWRFMENGQVDTSFGANGSTIIDFGTNDDRLNDIAVTDEGKLLISGSKQDGFHSAVLYRTLPNGSTDTGYGNAGIFVLPNVSGNNEVAIQSIILNNNRVITGLQQWSDSMDYGLLLTDADGAVDTTFGNGGMIVTPLENLQNLTCIAQQPDGKIVAAGFDQDATILMRYDMSQALPVASFTATDINLLVYPNPVTGHIIIHGLPSFTEATLYNVSGQALLEVTINGDTVIDMSNLASGAYLLKTAKGSAKIIKK